MRISTLSFQEGDIDYRTEEAENLRAWVESRPWCGQTVFIFDAAETNVHEPKWVAKDYSSSCSAASGHPSSRGGRNHKTPVNNELQAARDYSARVKQEKLRAEMDSLRATIPRGQQKQFLERF